jgi:nicotinamide mononucleotide transporter
MPERKYFISHRINCNSDYGVSSFIAGYLGDMMINGYFIMSIYGWYKWTRKVKGRDSSITRTNNKKKIIGIGLFYYNFVVFSIYKILTIK